MFIKGNIYFGRKCHPGAKRKRCSASEMNIPIKGSNGLGEYMIYIYIYIYMRGKEIVDNFTHENVVIYVVTPYIVTNKV